MRPFTRLDAVACPLPFSGIDTDQLIPARFMKRSRQDGYGDFLLHDRRFEADGRRRDDFPLDHVRYRGARILVARRNFGGGSSREAAVYALADYGIRCVVAPSFGDIFAANAVNNGLLPARVSEGDAEALLTILSERRPQLTVCLERRMVQDEEGRPLPFEIDPTYRRKLLNGWDDIDLTVSFADAIECFSARDALERPWATPSREA